MTPAPIAAFGKRRYDEFHDDEAPEPGHNRLFPVSRAVSETSKGRQGKSDPEGSAVRSWEPPQGCRQDPKIKVNKEAKETVRGAERLATPILHGLHYQPLLGPSFQQVLAVASCGCSAEGQPIWVEAECQSGSGTSH